MDLERTEPLRLQFSLFLQVYRMQLEKKKKKENQTGIFYDLTKAYDAINNDILFSKLQEYGVRGDGKFMV
jgi:hypothetical protein